VRMEKVDGAHPKNLRCGYCRAGAELVADPVFGGAPILQGVYFPAGS
jgi:hypothetical protein